MREIRFNEDGLPGWHNPLTQPTKSEEVIDGTTTVADITVMLRDKEEMLKKMNKIISSQVNDLGAAFDLQNINEFNLTERIKVLKGKAKSLEVELEKTQAIENKEIIALKKIVNDMNELLIIKFSKWLTKRDIPFKVKKGDFCREVFINGFDLSEKYKVGIESWTYKGQDAIYP
jgi:hypothetical protein